MTIALAVDRRQRDDAHVDGWPSTVRPRGRPAGTRFSAMSRSAMILMREIDARRPCGAGPWCSRCSTPSTRKRTRMSLPSGSKWMSEAPSSTAWAMIELTSLMTGASSADSRISVTIGELLARPPRRPRRPRRRAGHARDQRRRCPPASATTGRSLVAGHQLEVVEREHVRRVGHRDQQRAASSKPIGTAL